MVKFRKVFAMAVVMLSCASIQAQEERDSDGFSADLTVIPRLEGIQSFPLGSDANEDISWGNSSLYTLFEGNLNEHFSFSVCNHWLADDPEYLYQDTFYSNTTNWVDWVNLTYTLGNFSITAGKDMVTMGGIEYDDYDFDVYIDMCSGLWQNFACYQWGAKAALEVPLPQFHVCISVQHFPLWGASIRQRTLQLFPILEWGVRPTQNNLEHDCGRR
jgi:hypothetical protein